MTSTWSYTTYIGPCQVVELNKIAVAFFFISGSHSNERVEIIALDTQVMSATIKLLQICFHVHVFI